MKFYVAGKWQDRYAVRWLQEQLRRMGGEITVDWTTHDYGPNGVLATPEQLRQIALEDEEGVRQADAVVGVLLSDYNYKGVWVEFGIALALHKFVYTVGEAGDSCMFMNHPRICKFRTMEDFLKHVDGALHPW